MAHDGSRDYEAECDALETMGQSTSYKDFSEICRQVQAQTRRRDARILAKLRRKVAEQEAT